MWDRILHSYLNGNIAVGSSDHARDGQRNIILDRVGAVGADEPGLVGLGQGRPDKLQGLLQSIGVLGAGVQDVRSQLEAGQDAGVGVDLVQGQQHGLQPLDAPLFVDLAAVLRPVPLLVHGEKPPDDQVPIQDDLPLGGHGRAGDARPDPWGQELQQEQQEEGQVVGRPGARACGPHCGRS